MLTEKVVEFTLDFKPEDNYIVFDAEKFEQFRKQQLPWLADLPTGLPNNPPKNAVQLGDFRLFNSELPRFSMQKLFFDSKPRLTRNRLDLQHGNKQYKVSFSGDVLIPLLQDDNYMAWMSLTPNEILTQRGQIKRTKGVTVVAGMGLGWFAAQALQRAKVTKVIVVDNNKDVLNYIGEKLQKIYDKPLELVHASAYDFDWQQPFDVAVWDIWQTFSSCAYDRKYITIKQKIESDGKTCVQWGSMRRG